MFNLILTTDFSMENQGENSKYLTKLENTLIKYNSNLLEGVTYVDDATYINCVELLSMLCPKSPLLENDKNVIFIKDINENTIEILKEKVKGAYRFYLNPQGLNVRFIYKYGELVSATTFGRSFRKQDVLKLMISMGLDRNDMLSDYENIEISGVIVLMFDYMSIAEKYCSVWDAYQGVFSAMQYEILEKENNDEESESDSLLSFIATDVKIDNEKIENTYEFLEENGFIIPTLYEKEIDNFAFGLEDIIAQSEYDKLEYEYLTDGIRILTDEDVIILKVGSWKITTFTAIIDKIEWKDEKGKKIPVLKFVEDVKVNSDLTVSELVLNSINLLLILNIEIGGYIKFADFGSMGLLPITEKNDIILN